MRVKYDIDTQLVFQIGDPVAHSVAAFMHNASYEMAGVNAVCVLAHVPNGHLGEFVNAVKLINANGFDLTMPFKTQIIDYLDECDEASRMFKCVNHVKYRDGKLIGTGLDGVGMGSAIAHATEVTGKTVMILGAGAVAGPIAADLCQRGAAKVIIANRTVEKAEDIAEKLQKLYTVTTETGPLTMEFLEKSMPETDILVQCTSIGLAGKTAAFESLDFMKLAKPTCLCADVQYPTSAFLDKAEALGLKNINGMGMLLYQMIAMIEFRFGITLPERSLSCIEDSMVAAVAMRTLRESRLRAKND